MVKPFNMTKLLLHSHVTLETLKKNDIPCKEELLVYSS